MSDIRQLESSKIINAYGDVEMALQSVGRLLRTTEAGKFMWSAEHKTAIAGLKVIVRQLRSDVPRYDE